MRNSFWSLPQWGGNPYLHLLEGENGKRRRGPNESRDKDSPSTMCQWPSQRQDERVDVRTTFVLRMGTILEGVRTTSWPTAWRCGKDTGKIPLYYFPWKNFKFYIMKEKDKWTPWWLNTSKLFSCTSPEQLTSSIPINESRDYKGCPTSHHLKWGPLSPNEICIISQVIMEKEKWKERRKENP